MKRLFLLISILSIGWDSYAEPRSDGWPEEDILGFFSDEEAIIATEDIEPYVPVEIHLLALLQLSFTEGLSFARFSVSNLPANDGYPTGQYTMEFTSNLTLGEIDHDFSITWSDPLGAGNWMAPIGVFEFLMFDSDWIGEDHMISVRRGLECDCLYTIDGSGQAHGAIGCSFVFNCTAPEVCNWFYMPCWSGEPPVATEDSSWSHVKALF